MNSFRCKNCRGEVVMKPGLMPAIRDLCPGCSAESVNLLEDLSDIDYLLDDDDYAGLDFDLVDGE